MSIIDVILNEKYEHKSSMNEDFKYISLGKYVTEINLLGSNLNQIVHILHRTKINYIDRNQLILLKESIDKIKLVIEKAKKLIQK